MSQGEQTRKPGGPPFGNREALLEAAPSLAEPQIEPSDHCFTVLQDYGPAGGGWGPAAILLPWESAPIPFVYTGSAPHVTEVLTSLCRELAQVTGKPTRLVRYSSREDVAVFGGSS